MNITFLFESTFSFSDFATRKDPTEHQNSCSEHAHMTPSLLISGVWEQRLRSSSLPYVYAVMMMMMMMTTMKLIQI